MAATSSSPSAEPCALPVFCRVGAGQAIVVRSPMNVGRLGLVAGGVERRVEALDVDVAVRRAVDDWTCQP